MAQCPALPLRQGGGARERKLGAACIPPGHSLEMQTLILSQGNHQCAHLGLTSSSNGHT